MPYIWNWLSTRLSQKNVDFSHQPKLPHNNSWHISSLWKVISLWVFCQNLFDGNYPHSFNDLFLRVFKNPRYFSLFILHISGRYITWLGPCYLLGKKPRAVSFTSYQRNNWTIYLGSARQWIQVNAQLFMIQSRGCKISEVTHCSDAIAQKGMQVK